MTDATLAGSRIDSDSGSARISGKKIAATAGIALIVATGAFGVARLYPLTGPTAGTVAPAQRYIAPQVGAADVTLGDTSIPQLMQTDAFEVMAHNPSFRALASEPTLQP